MTARLDPSALRPHYSSFLTRPAGAPRRLLLTGHSHQAWPDVAREGLLEAFTVAAEHVDDKWSAVFAAQDELRRHIAERIGCAPDELAFAPNTHELVVRFLSALPLAKRPHIVTTTGEFHSAFRQLRRLAEEGVSVTFVPAEPAHTLAERLASEVTERTSAVVVSTVLFGTSTVVPGLAQLVERASRVGVEVLLDAYHAFDIVPLAVPARAFLVSGGYKYAQWGEGMCFLRVPAGCELSDPICRARFKLFHEQLAKLREQIFSLLPPGCLPKLADDIAVRAMVSHQHVWLTQWLDGIEKAGRATVPGDNAQSDVLLFRT